MEFGCNVYGPVDIDSNVEGESDGWVEEKWVHKADTGSAEAVTRLNLQAVMVRGAWTARGLAHR